MALTDKVAFCTLADLKTDLGITAATWDSALERRILAASALIEGYLGRSLRRESARVDKVAGLGWPTLYLPKRPVASVTSVVLDGSTVSPDAYELRDTERGCLYRSDGWTWTASIIASTAPEQVQGTEERAFVVTYVCGYVLPNDTDQAPTPKLPDPIVEACLQWAAQLHRNVGRDTLVAAEQVGDASIQYAAMSIEERRAGLPPPGVLSLLAPYRMIA